MRSFVQNLLASKPNPVGIDFGSQSLRVAQVRKDNGKTRLVAAEQREVPPEIAKNALARRDFFTEALREMFSEGKFTGRQVVLGLPASSTYIVHLRLPRMAPRALEESLAWEIKGKLPIDPSHAILRHMVAGEVFVEQEPRDEVIVMACRREMVQGLIAAAEKARLDVVGMNVEAAAIVECFAQVYRRKGDDEAVNCFLDIGSNTSRVMVSCGRQILFVRSIDAGAAHLNGAVAAELQISVAEAAARRQQMAAKYVEEAAMAAVNSTTVYARPEDRRRDLREMDSEENIMDEIILSTRNVTDKFVEELNLCRRYYDSTFPNKNIDRLIFVGGGSNDRRVCQEIARGAGLPAQVGDPVVRVEGREMIDQGIRHPQPAWGVVMGLTLGGST